MEHYLDNAATTKPCAEAAEAVVRCMTEQYGNPSSLHRKGLEAPHVMEHARQQVRRWHSWNSRALQSLPWHRMQTADITQKTSCGKWTETPVWSA